MPEAQSLPRFCNIGIASAKVNVSAIAVLFMVIMTAPLGADRLEIEKRARKVLEAYLFLRFALHKGLRINKVYISTHEAKLNSSSLHEKLLAPS
jgi:hypothetical protein